MSATIPSRSAFFDVAIGERQVEIFGDGEIVEQVILLENEADIFFVQLDAVAIIELVDRVIEQVVFAFPRAVEHADDAHQRGLARARWSHDRDEVAFRDVQVDAAQHPGLPRARFVNFSTFVSLDQVASRSLTIYGRVWAAANRRSVTISVASSGPIAPAEIADRSENQFACSSAESECVQFLEQFEQARHRQILRRRHHGASVTPSVKSNSAIAGSEVDRLPCDNDCSWKNAENSATGGQAFVRCRHG